MSTMRVGDPITIIVRHATNSRQLYLLHAFVIAVQDMYFTDAHFVYKGVHARDEGITWLSGHVGAASACGQALLAAASLLDGSTQERIPQLWATGN